MIFRRGVPGGASLFDSEESYEERKKYFYPYGPAVLHPVFPGGKCESR